VGASGISDGIPGVSLFVNIAMFSDQFCPELGGIPDSVNAIARALSAQGHSIRLHVPKYNRSGPMRLDRNLRSDDLENHVPLCRRRAVTYPSKVIRARLCMPSVSKWMRILHRQRPDLIHVQSFLGLGLEGLAAGRLLKIPVVATNHTAVRSFAAYFPVPTNIVARFVTWFCNRCDAVTAPSGTAFDDLDRVRLYRPLHIISNPVDLDTFHTVPLAKKEQLKRELRLPRSVICYAGRLAPEKNIGSVFRAIDILRNRYPDLMLLVAGGGSEYENLVSLSKSLGITGNVRFVGILDHRRLATLFQACDTFVTMSTGETQCLALLQAMACGLPTVCARSLAFLETVTHGGNGLLVEPGAVDELAGQLSLLLEETRASEFMGKTAARSARKYDLWKIVREWEELYTGIIQSHRIA
jgi:1,2-diacylglycerol 3-alpha-glucosyltransferase